MTEDMTAWDVETAKVVLKAMESYDIFFYEEPINYNNVEGYAELCRSTSVPVAGGECLSTREEFRQYAQLGAFDIAQPEAPGLGIRLSDELKARYPFVPGSGEWNAVPGRSEFI